MPLLAAASVQGNNLDKNQALNSLKSGFRIAPEVLQIRLQHPAVVI